MNADLNALRQRIDSIDAQLLALLNERTEIAEAIQRSKVALNVPTYSPQREQELLDNLCSNNAGPLSDSEVRGIFSSLLKYSVRHMREYQNRLAAPAPAPEQPLIIAGPCAVESQEQMDQVATFMAAKGIPFLRGGAYKPRSSPYSFQGLGAEGLAMLAKAAQAHGLKAVSEIVNPADVALATRYLDVIQIGARNMANTALLREVGRHQTAVLLKRGLTATLEELLASAELILAQGNRNIMLCERGIRTFENETRNTLDIRAISLLKERCPFPVIADISHAAGRKDILAPLAQAALSAGADGLMIEVHPSPHTARSDQQQQLDFDAFEAFLDRTHLQRAWGAAS